MLPPRLLALPFLAAQLAACSPDPQSGRAALCRANIGKWLPAPKASEFLEFSDISQQEWEEGTADAMAYRLYRDDYSPMTNFFRTQNRRLAYQVGESVRAKGGSFHRYAIRFRTESGSMLDSTQFCTVTAKECACVSREEMDVTRSSPPPG